MLESSNSDNGYAVNISNAFNNKHQFYNGLQR